MLIPEMYNKNDIYTLEESIIISQGIKRTKTHFNEQVALYLWKEWNNNKTIENRDTFLLILYPLITKLLGPFIRFIEDDTYSFQYDDLFQSTVLKAIESMPKYSPVRLNKAGETSRIFTYFTLILQYHLKTITAKEYIKYKAKTEYGEESKVSNASTVFIEFCMFAEKFADRKNIRLKHKEIYLHLSRLSINDPNISDYVNNLIDTLAYNCNTTKQDVESALRLLRKAYGALKITNNSIYLYPEREE